MVKRKEAFNENWICYRTGKREEAFSVVLPHDAMLLDGKSENSPGGVNTGWYDVQDYTYEKTFFCPEEYKTGNVILEFEGVYHRATLYLNDKKVTYHDYGYTGFYIDLSKELCFGENNTIRVEVVNSDQPNSRWYSGTGIYRPVWIYYLPKEYIQLEGIRITTLDYKNPKIRIEAEFCGKQSVRIDILENEKILWTIEGEVDSENRFRADIELPGAKLWSPEQPFLYTCRVTYGEDVQEERFGIRVIE